MGSLRKKEMVLKRFCRFLSCCSKTDDEAGPSSPAAGYPIPPSPQRIDWEQSISHGLGKPCSICADDNRLATHTAPCGHSACEHCWAAWPGRCMFCNAEVITTV